MSRPAKWKKESGVDRSATTPRKNWTMPGGRDSLRRRFQVWSTTLDAVEYNRLEPFEGQIRFHLASRACDGHFFSRSLNVRPNVPYPSQCSSFFWKPRLSRLLSVPSAAEANFELWTAPRPWLVSLFSFRYPNNSRSFKGFVNRNV